MSDSKCKRPILRLALDCKVVELVSIFDKNGPAGAGTEVTAARLTTPRGRNELEPSLHWKRKVVNFRTVVGRSAPRKRKGVHLWKHA
jgi:hypothetical protein